MSNKLTAAVAQTATVLLDTPATIDRALALMAEAAARGAQLLVFPEAFVGGYPKGADFHIYLGGARCRVALNSSGTSTPR